MHVCFLFLLALCCSRLCFCFVVPCTRYEFGVIKVERKPDEHVVLCALTNVECGSCCEQHAGLSIKVQE